MVLDWAHTPKTDIQHHTTGPLHGILRARDIEEVGYNWGEIEDGPG